MVCYTREGSPHNVCALLLVLVLSLSVGENTKLKYVYTQLGVWQARIYAPSVVPRLRCQSGSETNPRRERSHARCSTTAFIARQKPRPAAWTIGLAIIYTGHELLEVFLHARSAFSRYKSPRYVDTKLA